jgi:hypothetical protein
MLKQVFMKIFDVLKKLPVPTQIVSHTSILEFFLLWGHKNLGKCWTNFQSVLCCFPTVLYSNKE